MPQFVDSHSGLFKSFAETDCFECHIVISGGSDRPDDPGFLTIESVSSHDTAYKLSWRGRWFWIKKFLKGEPYIEIEFSSANKVDKFIETLKEARNYTWKTKADGHDPLD